jgi:hypothetical protein
VDTAAPETLPATASDAESDAAPALSDLIAAGLVSHEMIGDPAQLGAEAPTLTALCGLIGGPVYRVDPFHYAFRAGPEDLGGRLGQLAADDWTEALAAALRAALGEDAVWLSATDPLPDAAAPLDQPLLLLRAHASAVAEAVTAAAPGLRAVIDARYAAETARLTAQQIARQAIGAEAGTPLARRLAVIELRQEAILERLTDLSRPAAPDPALARLSETLNATLAAILGRLDAQAAALDTQGARAEDLAGQLIGLSAALAGGTLAAGPLTDGPLTGPAAFQETLGLTLAEFLARLERQSQEAAPARVPQFN